MRTLGLLLPLGLLGLAASFELVVVTGAGMVPTLLPGDTVLLRRSWLGDAERGEVVVFAEDGVRYPRRVVGLEGDEVALEAGLLTVDGQVVATDARKELEVPMGRCGRRTSVLVEEVHGPAHAWVQAAGSYESEVVPPGSLFLLGDHRREASDSRQWGAVSMAAVEGTVVAVLWSVDPCDGAWRWPRVGQRIDLW